MAVMAGSGSLELAACSLPLGAFPVPRFQAACHQHLLMLAATGRLWLTLSCAFLLARVPRRLSESPGAAGPCARLARFANMCVAP
jgi:hypothetical protein